MRNLKQFPYSEEVAKTLSPMGTVRDVLNDVLYCCRRLMNKPGYATVAVLSLAIGVGANSAVFSVMNALLYRPDSERLVILSGERAGGHRQTRGCVIRHGFDELPYACNGWIPGDERDSDTMAVALRPHHRVNGFGSGGRSPQVYGSRYGRFPAEACPLG